MSTVQVGVVEWDGDVDEREIYSMTAALDPDYQGTGQQVSKWVAQLHRVSRIEVIDADLTRRPDNYWLLTPISRRVSVAAPAAAGNVTFTFADGETVPRVGAPPKIVWEGTDKDASDSIFVDQNSPRFSTTVVMIAAYKADNTIAGSVAWYADKDNATVTSNGHTVQGWKLTSIDAGIAVSGAQTMWQEQDRLSGCPRFTLSGKAYTAKTITWTTSGLDIGNNPAASTDLEIVAEGQEPGDSSLTYQLHDGASWFTVVDGDVIGVDKSDDGGSDLSAMVRTDAYNARVTLTPNTAANVSPVLRRIGIRELTREETDGAVEFGRVAWAVDPLSLAAEVSEARFVLLKDGARDYRDLGSDLLARYYPNEIDLRVWIGHPDLEKQYWLLVDEFVLDDYTPRDGSIELLAVSPMAHLLRDVPVTDITASEVAALNYTVSTLKSAYDDLLTGQIGVPSRYIGPGIEDTTNVSKMIRKPRTGLDEVSRLAFLAGGAIVSSQGRFKFRPFYSENVQPVASFGVDETTILAMSPGLRRRISQYNVPYAWSERRDQGRGGYGGEYVAKVNDTILGRMGRGLLDRSEKLDDETAQWVLSSTLAGTVAERILGRFSQGELLIRFRADVPHPHLEVGDFVTVDTDEFVGRDPREGTAIRGPVSAGGHIVQQHDWEGREFTIWVPEPLYVIPATATLTDNTIADPELLGPQVNSATLDWQPATADGYLTVTADANTAKLYVTVGTTGALPADPSSTGGWTFASTTNTLTASSTLFSLGAASIVKARGWNSAAQGDVAQYRFAPDVEDTTIDDADLRMAIGTTTWTRGPGYLTPSTTVGDVSGSYRVPLPAWPVGTQVDTITARLYRASTDALARFDRGEAQNSTGGIGWSLGTSSPSVGWAEVSDDGFLVKTGYRYGVSVTLTNSSGDKAGVDWVKFDYTLPSFTVST